jgi:RND family efflux transporter MFP subunit
MPEVNGRAHRRMVCFALAMLAASLVQGATSLTITGVTEPFFDVSLSAPVSGIINTQCFKEGQSVKKGDVLVELDKRLEELELARRKAVMDRAKTDLDSTRVLVTTTKSVSQEELGKKETDYNVAAAEYGIAAEQLARRQICAPFSGAISEILLQPGSACAPYQPIIRLVDTSRCYFVGHLEGKLVSALRLNDEVKIEVEAAGTVTAKISYIAPVVDPASGLAKVKAIIENPEGRIRPGVAGRMTRTE